MTGPICVRCGQPIVDGRMPVATPAGYQHDRCPPRGMQPTTIVAIVGCGALALLVFAFLVFVAIWQFLSPDKPTSTTPDAGEVLSERFASTNGFVTVRYPPSFAASTPNEHVVLLQRRGPGGEEHVVAVDAVDHPVSEHLAEVDRVVRLEAGKRYPDFAAGPAVATTCHGEPAIESSGTFTDASFAYTERACAFMVAKRYHRCSYIGPTAEMAELTPLFEQICASVEIPP